MGFRDLLRRSRPPHDADGLVLRELRKLEANLDEPREVIHYLYFPTEGAACAAARELEKHAYDVDVHADDDESSWSVIARGRAAVDETTVAQMREQLEGLAGLHGGDYDGWEAAAD